MKFYQLFAFLFLLIVAASAQEKSNDEINRQIRSLGVDHLTLAFDQASNMTKIMAVSENFSDGDAGAAGVQAMNFAMAFSYLGSSLKQPPESVHFAFWVLTKKPRFAENHHLIVDVDGRSIDLGDARYAAKPGQNMEYVNFEIPRTDLASIGAGNKVTFRLGTHTFTASSAQIKTIRSVATIGTL